VKIKENHTHHLPVTHPQITNEDRDGYVGDVEQQERYGLCQNHLNTDQVNATEPTDSSTN